MADSVNAGEILGLTKKHILTIRLN